MKVSVWAYDKDKYWLMDLIDAVKGKAHCEKQWTLKMRETMPMYKVHELNKKKKFWRL